MSIAGYSDLERQMLEQTRKRKPIVPSQQVIDSAYANAGISIPPPPPIDPLANEPAGSPARIQAAQGTLNASRRVGESDVAFENRIGNEPNLDIQKAMQPQPFIAPPNATAPTQHHAYAAGHGNFAYDTNHPPDITQHPVQFDTETILNNPAQSFRAITARGVRFGQIVSTPDGSNYQVGKQSLMPVVFDENSGGWKNRDQFIQNAALTNPGISREFAKLEQKYQGITDPSKFTTQQQAQLLPQHERDLNALAQRAARGAIPEKTAQQQYDSGDNFVNAKDGSVWHIDPKSGKATKIDAAHHERQAAAKPPNKAELEYTSIKSALIASSDPVSALNLMFPPIEGKPDPKRVQALLSIIIDPRTTHDELVAIDQKFPKGALEGAGYVRDVLHQRLAQMEAQPQQVAMKTPSPANSEVVAQRAPDTFPNPENLPMPKNNAEYNALPSGTRYIHPSDGHTKVKP